MVCVSPSGPATQIPSNTVSAICLGSQADIAPYLSVSGIWISSIYRSVVDSLEISDAALHKTAEASYDPVHGARPLKCAIQQYIENPLSKAF